MHEKTSSGRWKVALVYRCGGGDKCAVFNDFKIDGENEKFKLHVGAEVSRKGFQYRTLDYHNDMAFTTSDRDNDRDNGNCASKSHFLGGWWFKYCGYYCPNCKYHVVNSGCTHTFMVMKRIWYSSYCNCTMTLPEIFHNVKSSYTRHVSCERWGGAGALDRFLAWIQWFKKNALRTDGPTDLRTDGQTLI